MCCSTQTVDRIDTSHQGAYYPIILGWTSTVSKEFLGSLVINNSNPCEMHISCSDTRFLK